MAYEKYVKRILWVAQCSSCGDRTERTDNPPRERFCNKCKVWIPFVEESYVGPEFKRT